ncbi:MULTISPECIES: GNAT family N-acetyltransferase [Pandoraea]|uniref:GNAT family N-acetyltransferase n=1 Tax=Pandoraea TaxID=93217 RepID=UPI001F5D4423|nr:MULTISPECIES: GNAT family N-acetyltransferase [Pandoraea]MCI3206443.1 hypothetical protein [Pandoraea sp. LA3]MDN4584471.1 hypothetical protein [Pandoraea capi]
MEIAMNEGHLDVVSICRAEDVEESALRARADLGWRVWTSGFLARVDGCEAGLLMLDFYDRTSTAKVYEILVLSQFRRRGIAKVLMRRAEGAAKAMGARILELEAHPLDEQTKLAMLRYWYSSMGFNGKRDSRLMTKSLSPGYNE